MATLTPRRAMFWHGFSIVLLGAMLLPITRDWLCAVLVGLGLAIMHGTKAEGRVHQTDSLYDRLYWRVRRGKVHTHDSTEHEGYVMDRLTHAHHWAGRSHKGWRS